MSQDIGPYVPEDRSAAVEPSTTDIARDEAADVGQHAREAGSQVAQTAADQARQVVAETGRQARDLLGEAQGQARAQASTQQQMAARQLRTVADELHEMVANGGQSGLATEVARQAADRVDGAASWLEQREPGDLLESVRDFARRRPGAFLAGAAVAGLAAGRLTRGLAGGSGSRPGPQRSTVSGVPAAATMEPAVPAGTGYTAEPPYTATSEPVSPTTPAYPADAAYPAEPAHPGDAAYPDDTAQAGYQAESANPAEPGPARRHGGPGQP
jgi:hypothetical protein